MRPKARTPAGTGWSERCFAIAAQAGVRHSLVVLFSRIFFRHGLSRLSALPAALCLILLAGCDGQRATTAPSSVAGPAVPLYRYKVVKVWPHDRNAFTQGLVWLDGTLIESTGLNGRSSLRRVELKTGHVLRQIDVSAEFFAEGLAVLNGNIFQLTWQNHRAFVYDLATFARKQELTYAGEGWGLATDGRELIMSDGTAQIRFLDPVTFAVTRSIIVNLRDESLPMLNELEYVQGEIWANIWQTDVIARIDSVSGQVLGLIDLAGLLPAADRDPNTDVLNGIAYDAAENRIFVTGKNWPKIFEIRLVPK